MVQSLFLNLHIWSRKTWLAHVLLTSLDGWSQQVLLIFHSSSVCHSYFSASERRLKGLRHA